MTTPSREETAGGPEGPPAHGLDQKGVVTPGRTSSTACSWAGRSEISPLARLPRGGVDAEGVQRYRRGELASAQGDPCPGLAIGYAPGLGGRARAEWHRGRRLGISSCRRSSRH